MIKNFKLFIEDATATMGNMNGMGNVTSAIPSETPGSVSDSIPGSGDIGQILGTHTKKSTLDLRKKKKKKKDLKKKENFSHEQDKTYDQMYVVRFGDYKYTK